MNAPKEPQNTPEPATPVAQPIRASDAATQGADSLGAAGGELLPCLTVQKDWDDLSGFTDEAKAHAMFNLALSLEGDLNEVIRQHEFPPPTWANVQQAFLDGAREARVNPAATEDHFKRASDGYVKLKYHDKTGKYSA